MAIAGCSPGLDEAPRRLLRQGLHHPGARPTEGVPYTRRSGASQEEDPTKNSNGSGSTWTIADSFGPIARRGGLSKPMSADALRLFATVPA